MWISGIKMEFGRIIRTHLRALVDFFSVFSRNNTRYGGASGRRVDIYGREVDGDAYPDEVVSFGDMPRLPVKRSSKEPRVEIAWSTHRLASL